MAHKFLRTKRRLFAE